MPQLDALQYAVKVALIVVVAIATTALVDATVKGVFRRSTSIFTVTA
jgi:Flp pilus assembly pilin Flp